MKDLAVIIVNYNSKEFLARCLDSLPSSAGSVDFAAVVVDNASLDRDFSQLERGHHWAQFILNSRNMGFSVGCNQGINAVEARRYLFLNPDCLPGKGAIESCWRFLEENPQAGIVGCRINHPDGSLQLACRRSIPSPWPALCRILKLSLLFPKSRVFAAYNLTYLDENETSQVEAVSGSFMMWRRELIDTSGMMDEDYFLYGEDLDFCLRAAQAGWEVYYFPQAEAVHYKGRSVATDARRSRFHFYDAMEIFYRKHFSKGRSRLGGWLIIRAIRLMHRMQSLKAALSKDGRVVSEY